MEEVVTARAHKALFLNTVAFTICFAVWMLNGVLVTFLSSNQVYDWGPDSGPDRFDFPVTSRHAN